jgi:5'-nucleotidase
MKILLTNDDGILAEGLAVLRRSLEPLATVWVVAPEREQSGASHALTLHRPLRLRQIEERVYSVDGTPTDCVLLARRGLPDLADSTIDLIVSGINHGANLCEDVAYSGTVAAAMEGRMLGLPSIAISLQSWHPGGFETAGRVAAMMARLAGEKGIPNGVVLNVNVPQRPWEELKGVRITRLGKRHYAGSVFRKTDPRGRPYYWIGEEPASFEPQPGSDAEALAQGYVSVTPIHLDLTDHGAREQIAAWGLPADGMESVR